MLAHMHSGKCRIQHFVEACLMLCAKSQDTLSSAASNLIILFFICPLWEMQYQLACVPLYRNMKYMRKKRWRWKINPRKSKFDRGLTDQNSAGQTWSLDSVLALTRLQLLPLVWLVRWHVSEGLRNTVPTQSFYLKHVLPQNMGQNTFNLWKVVTGVHFWLMVYCPVLTSNAPSEL